MVHSTTDLRCGVIFSWSLLDSAWGGASSCQSHNTAEVWSDILLVSSTKVLRGLAIHLVCAGDFPQVTF